MAPALADPATVAGWVTDRMDEDDLPYAIGGALALAAHGFPRATADVDLAVFVSEADVSRLFAALERAGCAFSPAAARAAVRRVALFTVRCGRVLVDVFVSFHPLHHESLARRVRLRCPDGIERWFLSAEDLAVHKLALARPKDVVDLERLFAARGADLDVAYVRRWVRAVAGRHDPRTALLERLIRRFVRRRG
ncbi:MAG: hypothetical protein HY906_06410 [Deltaproteobacteria bacterium]|nr:hypothetical protein [Deltaproteobacteria bacterium]